MVLFLPRLKKEQLCQEATCTSQGLGLLNTWQTIVYLSPDSGFTNERPNLCFCAVLRMWRKRAGPGRRGCSDSDWHGRGEEGSFPVISLQTCISKERVCLFPGQRFLQSKRQLIFLRNFISLLCVPRRSPWHLVCEISPTGKASPTFHTLFRTVPIEFPSKCSIPSR